jgi:hypothetical protein
LVKTRDVAAERELRAVLVLVVLVVLVMLVVVLEEEEEGRAPAECHLPRPLGLGEPTCLRASPVPNCDDDAEEDEVAIAGRYCRPRVRKPTRWPIQARKCAARGERRRRSAGAPLRRRADEQRQMKRERGYG